VEVPAGPEAAVVVAMTVVVAPAVVVMTVVAAAAEDEAGVAVDAAEDDKVALAGRYAPVTSLLEFRLARLFLERKLSDLLGNTTLEYVLHIADLTGIADCNASIGGTTSIDAISQSRSVDVLQITAVEVSGAVDLERLVVGDIVALVFLRALGLSGANTCSPEGKGGSLEKSRSHC
jgi:hypothetical protein